MISFSTIVECELAGKKISFLPCLLESLPNNHVEQVPRMASKECHDLGKVRHAKSCQNARQFLSRILSSKSMENS